MKKINVLSLFDGISCGKIALDNVGIESNYFSSEIDKNAIIISENNHKDIIRIGDVREVTKESIPKIDLLIGGSPCQSFSRSGNGSGFNGKSGLFFEFVRILKETKPKYFLLENVEMKKEWEDVISKELGIKPHKINSSLFSGQKRPRLYWTNIPFETEIQDQGVKLEDCLIGNMEVINDNPLIIGKEEDCILIKNATKKGYLKAYHGDSVNLEVPTSKTRRGRVGKQKTNTLNTACNYGVCLHGNLFKLNIETIERLQNLPVGYTDYVSESQRRKAIGNGWTVGVIEHIFKGLKNE